MNLPEVLKEVALYPRGLVLVTGTTGSGKSTTLAAMLNELNNKDARVIITIEDPIEYIHKDKKCIFYQREVGNDAEDFFSALRAALREDPDVILVGEMRDPETVRTALDAAETGHLVFSTLHTNDAPSTVTRLLDMEIEPFLVASSILLVIAQRLARTICPYCKEEYKYPVEVLEEVGFSRDEAEKLKTYKGKGCEYCDYTGYKGRVGLYEVMEVTPTIKDAILKGKTSEDIKSSSVYEEDVEDYTEKNKFRLISPVPLLLVGYTF